MLIPARSRIFPSLATETFVLVDKAYVPSRTFLYIGRLVCPLCEC